MRREACRLATTPVTLIFQAVDRRWTDGAHSSDRIGKPFIGCFKNPAKFQATVRLLGPESVDG